MQRDDLMVEVRDKTLARVGSISSRFLQLSAIPRANDVDDWVVNLPGDHPMVPHLATPGSGVIVHQRVADVAGVPTWEVLMSGPTNRPNRKRNRANPDGTLTFSGVSDDIVLADSLAYGDPTNEATAQAAANDTRTGTAQDLLHTYVNVNVGPGALASRRVGLASYLTVEASAGLGGVITKAPRFQTLLSLCQEIATLEGLRFQVVQDGDVLVFRSESVQDRTALVRLDIQNGTLESEETETTPPGVTRVIVAGQGEGAARSIVVRDSAGSLSAETEWGRRIEVWKDSRDKATTAELQQDGDEILAVSGSTIHSVRAVASDDQTMRYGIDWREGDLLAVVIDGVEYAVRVTSAAIQMGPDAVLVGAAIGNVQAMDENAALAAKVDNNSARISGLERNAEATALPEAAVAATPGTLVERDAAGRAQFASPSASADADTKGARDAAIGVETTARNAAIAAAGVDTPTANTVVRRDAAGRTAFASPSATDDAATKGYVDGKTWDGNDIVSGTVVAARLPASSETASGIIERATVAEAVAGTDTVRAVTPAGLAGAIAALPRVAGGQRSSAGSLSTGTGITVGINFPSGRFTAAPNVVVIPANSARLQCAVLSASATSASIRIDNFSGGTATDSSLSWVAVQG